MTRLRLKAVIQCSFVRSEASNLALFRKEGHYPGDLRKGEAFLFIAKGMNQVVFIFKTFKVEGRTVVDSRRLRLDGGTWNPMMLQNYANAVGINLAGVKRFEQIHDEMRLARRAKK